MKQWQFGLISAGSAIALRDEAPNCQTCEGESKCIFSVPHFNLSSASVFLKGKQTSERKVEKREKELSPSRYKSHKRDRPCPSRIRGSGLFW